MQEYGKNSGLKTVCFRAGCITGPNHSGAKLHGFLSYLVKASLKNNSYTLIGYKGKQVRDNIHSEDLVSCFWEYYKNPRKGEVYKSIVDSMPDVFNHNIETVSRLYKTIRPGAIYKESLNLLKSVKSYNSDIFTKSGLMVGLGETLEDIQKLLMDLRDHKVDFVTIGQYLQPSIHHEKVHKFYTPDEFKFLYDQCVEIGFKMVSSSPLTRSSYHADEDFIKLKKAI